MQHESTKLRNGKQLEDLTGATVTYGERLYTESKILIHPNLIIDWVPQTSLHKNLEKNGRAKRGPNDEVYPAFLWLGVDDIGCVCAGGCAKRSRVHHRASYGRDRRQYIGCGGEGYESR